MAYGPNQFAPSGGYGTAKPPSTAPPVQKMRRDFVTTDEDELRLERVVRRARLRARAAAAAAKKKELQQAGGGPVVGFDSQAFIASMAPQPPALPPIVDPTQQILGGLAGDVRGARQATARQQQEAQKALGNISGDPSVAGANVSDVYMGGLGGISGAQRGLGTDISAKVAEFVLRQMQDRTQAQQQYQQDQSRYQASLLASPAQIAALAQKGLLGKVDINDPYAVAAALAAPGQKEISDKTKLDLEDIGIDWHDYQFDNLGAQRLIRKQKSSPLSKAEAQALKDALK